MVGTKAGFSLGRISLAPLMPSHQGRAAERSLGAGQFMAVLLLVAVMWLATRQYHGIIHDSRLYTVQALNLLYPHRFSGDLYLRFGSQDKFTIYSYLYAPLIAALGISRAAMLAAVGGQAIWISGLAYLCRALFRDRLQALLATAAVIALPGFYGMFLGYGEPFATPRLFAEGFDLFALGFLLNGRYGWAPLMLALAVPLHPLMALAGLAFAVVYLALQRPVWWMVFAVGPVAACALALTGIPPFANLTSSFDQTWLEIVEALDPLCLITQWSINDDCRIVVIVAMAGLAVVATERQDRRFVISALVVGLGGIICTLIGSDLAHNVLIAQIQPWRSMWLLTLAANLYVVPVLRRLGREPARLDVARVSFINALIPCILSEFVPQFIYVAVPLMAIAVAIAFWQLRTGRRLPIAVRWLALFTAALGGIVTVLFCYAFKVMLDLWPHVFPARIASCLLLFAALISMALLLRRRRGVQWSRRAAFPITAVLFCLSLYWWDARDPWTQFIESSAPVPPSLATLLPANATVYWEGGMRLLWFRLRRPSYFACGQGAGVVFFRDTAIEFERRARSFWTLQTLDFVNGTVCAPFDDTAGRDRTRDDLRQVCRRESALNYLVLARPVEGVDGKTWMTPAVLRKLRQLGDRYTHFSTDRFYVYSCAELR